MLRKQREVIYGQRRDVLLKENIEDVVKPIAKRHLDRTVEEHIDPEQKNNPVDIDALFESVDGRILSPGLLDKKELSEDPENSKTVLKTLLEKTFSEKREEFGEKNFNEFLKVVVLRVVDTYWVQHIDQMSELRQSIGLRSYGQQNPLHDYQEIGFNMFEDMIATIEHDVTRYIFRARIRENLKRVQVAKPTKTSSGKEETKKKKPIRTKKVGRNDPCPCGSGKKYKHCHGR